MGITGPSTLFCCTMLNSFTVRVGSSVAFINVFIVQNGFVACVGLYDWSRTPNTCDDYLSDICRKFPFYTTATAAITLHPPP